jgi:hypothetical protein
MGLYIGLAIAGLVALGAIYFALRAIQSSSKEAGAATEAKAATEAANKGLDEALKQAEEQAEIVMKETPKSETVDRLRRGNF